MRYRRGARLDPSQIDDRRGRRRHPRRRACGRRRRTRPRRARDLPAAERAGRRRRPLRAARQPGRLDRRSGAAGTGARPGVPDRRGREHKEDCRIVADINSVQATGRSEFAVHGRDTRSAKTVFFTGSTDTGCGAASTDVGPFYCPVDKHVYIDLGFFDELRTRFGARGGPFAQAYVLAHEYGHHVQDLLGILGQGSSQAERDRTIGPNGAAGRLLRRRLGSPRHRRPVTSPTSRRRTSATRSTPRPPSATTGSSRRRKDKSTPRRGRTAPRRNAQHWFSRGYQTGQPSECDTFTGQI